MKEGLVLVQLVAKPIFTTWMLWSLVIHDLLQLDSDLTTGADSQVV